MFLVYRSSAGSGKTFTLVKQYLGIALQPPLQEKFRSILAITFTNKAASEMKDRVISTLEAISKGADHAMIPDLTEMLGITRPELEKRAGLLLTIMLHNYSDISISTIDKFTHRIIRTFAFDLQLPVNFEIEMDQERIAKDVADSLLLRIGQDPLVTKILTEFAVSRNEDEKNWDIERDLRQYAQLLLDEKTGDLMARNGLPSPTEIMAVREDLLEKIRGFENAIRQLGKDAMQVMSSAGVNPESLSGGKNGLGMFFNHLAAGTKICPSATIEKYAAGENWFPKTASGEVKSSISAIQPQLQEIFHNLKNRLEQYPAYCLQRIIIKNLYALALLSELADCYRELKEDENILPIAEFNRILVEVVRQEPAPFIYERIGEKYRHFLIDEFQDTSEMQWHNILPLVENGLASGTMSMVVGDAKQSIYRWRGGNAEQFINLPGIAGSDSDELLRFREQILTTNYRDLKLNRNFRSDPSIVKFNNAFFEFAAAALPPEAAKVYRDLRQECRDGEDGDIRFDLLVGSKEEMDDLHLYKVGELVGQLTGKGFRFGDIAVLVRSNKHGAAIAEYLNENHIPVVSQESLLLGSSSRVRLIINLWKYLSNPVISLNRASLITSLIENKRVDAGLDSLWEGVRDPAKLNTLLEGAGLITDAGRLKNLPIYDAAETLVRLCGMGNETDPYVTALLDLVHQFSRKTDDSFQAFLLWWDEKGCTKSINVPEGINAVRVLSIHKSKGLEFPAVILPFAEWGKHHPTSTGWITSPGEPAGNYLINYTKELEDAGFAEIYEAEKRNNRLDDLNMLYVAFTRAVNYLHVITSRPKRTGNDISNVICRYLETLDGYSESVNTYLLGRESRKAHQTEETVNKVYNFHSGEWRKNIRIAFSAPPQWDFENPEMGLNRGNLIHQLLSSCRTIREATVACEHVTCAENDRQWLQAIAENLSGDSQLAVCFDAAGKWFTERDLITPNGEVFRPDRVTFDETRTVVMDFKTGRPSQTHNEQIINYKQHLEAMNYPGVEAWLVYINEQSATLVKAG